MTVTNAANTIAFFSFTSSPPEPSNKPPVQHKARDGGNNGNMGSFSSNHCNSHSCGGFSKLTDVERNGPRTNGALLGVILIIIVVIVSIVDS